MLLQVFLILRAELCFNGQVPVVMHAQLSDQQVDSFQELGACRFSIREATFPGVCQLSPFPMSLHRQRQRRRLQADLVKALDALSDEARIPVPVFRALAKFLDRIGAPTFEQLQIPCFPLLLVLPKAFSDGCFSGLGPLLFFLCN